MIAAGNLIALCWRCSLTEDLVVDVDGGFSLPSSAPHGHRVRIRSEGHELVLEYRGKSWVQISETIPRPQLEEYQCGCGSMTGPCHQHDGLRRAGDTRLTSDEERIADLYDGYWRTG